MRLLNRNAYLLLAIFIEGYLVLAVELLALRQLIPFVGSGIEVVSITISAVLLPLSLGYHIGGLRYQRHAERAQAGLRKWSGVRLIISSNMLISLIILNFGLSFAALEVFFPLLESVHIHNFILQTFAYGFCFLVTPMFLLGQSVPLLSHYFARTTHNSKLTSRILACSTIGAFLGSVLTTLLLMNLVGVRYTVLFTLILLATLAVSLLPRRKPARILTYLVALGGVVWCHSYWMPPYIVADTAYSHIGVSELDEYGGTQFYVNRSPSSYYHPNPQWGTPHINYAERTYIKPTIDHGTPINILVLGAGGFMLGLKDTFNHYSFVDIDKNMKRVAEEHFLPNKLAENKTFVPLSARVFLKKETKQYDLIYIDLYSHMASMPAEAMTKEFLEEVKAKLAPGGRLISHTYTSSNFNSRFAVRYWNTFASVFPAFEYIPVNNFNGWDYTGKQTINYFFVYSDSAYINDNAAYVDDLNTSSMDH